MTITRIKRRTKLQKKCGEFSTFSIKLKEISQYCLELHNNMKSITMKNFTYQRPRSQNKLFDVMGIHMI